MKKHLSTAFLIIGALGLMAMVIVAHYSRQNEETPGDDAAATQPAETEAQAEAKTDEKPGTETPTPETQPAVVEKVVENIESPSTQPAIETEAVAGSFEALFKGAQPKSAEIPEDQLTGIILGEVGKDNNWKFSVKVHALGGGIRLVGLNEYDQIEWIKQEDGGYKRTMVPFPIQEEQRLSSMRTRDKSMTLEEQLKTLTYVNLPFSADLIRVSAGAESEHEEIYLLKTAAWELVEKSIDSVSWRIEIHSKDGVPVLELTRKIQIFEGKYDLRINQTVKNLTNIPIHIVVRQLGQSDVEKDYDAFMGGLQSLTVGYYNNEADPEHKSIYTDDYKRVSRKELMREPKYGNLWPTEKTVARKWESVWVSFSSRYFAAMVHHEVPENNEGRAIAALEEDFPWVFRYPREGVEDNELIEETGFVLAYETRKRELKAGETYSVGMGAYLGPKDRRILNEQPYAAMHLSDVIIYQVSTCFIYVFCAFGFISKFLLTLMTILHDYVTFGDWAVAIILLVVIVRLALHPILRKSQMNMMKFGKRMQELAPEIDKLKKKYGDDPKKLNAEMMLLYREKGVNPVVGGLGCLPMFLQMPIWIGLYNMLATAIELRQTPAFFGLFQNFWDWTFMEDLARQDAFIPLQPWLGPEGFIIPLIGTSITSVNILPFLMAAVFILNQKFAQAHTTAPQTDQAKQQQMMMKFMMLLFPLFLYTAPSGLTLYIMTSSTLGIFESYLIRKSLKKQEERDEAAKNEPQEPMARKIESTSKKVK